MKKYILFVLTGAASYGMLSSFAKTAYREGYNAAEITFAQAAIGALLLWMPVLVKRIKEKQLPSLANWRLILAGMGIGISTYTYYLAVQYIPASLAIILLMQMTWMSIFMEWLFFKRKPLNIELYVTAVILTGTVLAGNLLHAGTFAFSLIGIVYGLLSALTYAIAVICTSRLGTKVPMFEKSAMMITGSAAIIFMINFNTLWHSEHFDGRLLQWGTFLALFGTVIPPVLFTKGMPKIGAGLSAILVTMELPVAVLCAHFILKEEVNSLQILGILLMLGAIIYLNIYKEKKPVVVTPVREFAEI